MVKTLYEQMEELNIKVCPICGKEYTGHSAISRKDNKTEICSHCGQMEALDAYINATFEGDKRSDTKYCTIENKICRYANKDGNVFQCEAPSDLSLKFLCK